MAFLRVEKKKSGQYLRILEAYRDEGKTRHRVVASLGKVEDYTPGMLHRIGERLYELGGGNLKDLLGEGLEELARYNYGFLEATQKGMPPAGPSTSNKSLVLAACAELVSVSTLVPCMSKQLRVLKPSLRKLRRLSEMMKERLKKPGTLICGWFLLYSIDDKLPFYNQLTFLRVINNIIFIFP